MQSDHTILCKVNLQKLQHWTANIAKQKPLEQSFNFSWNITENQDSNPGKCQTCIGSRETMFTGPSTKHLQTIYERHGCFPVKGHP